jgi:mycothiol S-conjugate amidase
MQERLCLLAVHAHPDDEASKGAGSVARYSAEGVHTVLVTCTGGEEGEILNPAMDLPEVRDNLFEVRNEELRRAVDIIGYSELVLMGYRDSGMAGSEANARPDCFAQAPFDEAVGRLVEVIRRTRPQVIITYNDDQTGYPHPDHLRVHDISVVAFDAAADPDAFAGLGEPWQPLKMYYSVWSRARMMAMHEKFVELGIESPYSEEWLNRPHHDDRVTTRVDITDHTDVRRDALLAHATQVDPNSPFWFGLPPEVLRTVHPIEEYVLARDLTRTSEQLGEGEMEDDLFAGIRQGASR